MRTRASAEYVARCSRETGKEGEKSPCFMSDSGLAMPGLSSVPMLSLQSRNLGDRVGRWPQLHMCTGWLPQKLHIGHEALVSVLIPPSAEQFPDS